MTRYEQGFMNKCAEYGLDVGTSVALMKKIAERDHWAGANTGAGIGMMAAGIPTAALAGHTGFYNAALGNPSVARIAMMRNPIERIGAMEARDMVGAHVNPVIGRLIAKSKGAGPEELAALPQGRKALKRVAHDAFKKMKFKGKLGVIGRALSDAAFMSVVPATAAGTVGAVVGGAIGKKKKPAQKK